MEKLCAPISSPALPPSPQAELFSSELTGGTIWMSPSGIRMQESVYGSQRRRPSTMTSQRWLVSLCAFAFSFPKRNLLVGRSFEGIRGGSL